MNESMYENNVLHTSQNDASKNKNMWSTSYRLKKKVR